MMLLGKNFTPYNNHSSFLVTLEYASKQFARYMLQTKYFKIRDVDDLEKSLDLTLTNRPKWKMLQE